MEIPKFIQEELKRISDKKSLRKVEGKKYSPKQLLVKALKNLEFLNEIAETEPIHSFLLKEGILILDHFEPDFPDTVREPNGGLWLVTVNKKTGLFYWLDADYPANRSDRDYELITAEGIKEWHPKSVARFATLTKREIWKAIKDWLRIIEE